MAYRVDPAFFNHPRYVNQSNYNANNSSPSTEAVPMNRPMQYFPHHCLAIHQTSSSYSPCRHALQLHRWPTSGQVPYYTMIPQERMVPYVQGLSQYSNQPMMIAACYPPAGQFSHSYQCFGHDTGCISPSLIELNSTDSTTEVQIGMDKKDEAQKPKTKEQEKPYYILSSTHEKSLLQEPNIKKVIFTSQSNISEQSTAWSPVSVSSDEHHTSTAAASTSAFSPFKLLEDSKLIVSIPISILQCVPKPSSSLKQTTISCSDSDYDSLVMEKLNELLKESPLLSGHDRQSIQDFFKGSTCSTSSISCNLRPSMLFKTKDLYDRVIDINKTTTALLGMSTPPTIVMLLLLGVVVCVICLLIYYRNSAGKLP